MSLIHWWPLNGDTQDKITGQYGSLVGGGNVNGSGKIGKCYSSTNNASNVASSSDGISVPNCSLVNEVGNQYSFACWFLVHGTHGQYQSCIMSSGDWNAQNCWVIGFNRENTSISCPVNGYNRGLIPIGFTLTNNKWYHLATVYDNGTSYAYLDGELIGSIANPGIYQSSSTTACIGRDQAHGGFFPYNGDINDLRIYDHALSQAEVKELSKALVMHYTFDDVLAKPTTNLLPASQQTQSNSAATINVTSGLVSGATYTLSTYITRDPACTSTNPRLTLRFFYSDGTNTSVSKYNDGGASYPKDGVERYYFITATANPAKTLTSVGGWLMDHSSGSGKKMTATRSQLEISAYPTPYTPTTRESMLVDEAGLSEVTNTRNVDLSENAASGQYSLQSNDTWIKTMSNSQYQRDITLSAWVNPASFGGDCIIIGGCYLTVTGAGKLSAYCYGKDPAGYHTGSTVMSVGTWYHLAVVWDGSTCVGYINGEQEFTKSSTGSANSSPNHLKKDIGSENGTSRKFNGLIDDVRIYHTALSADDIKDLYSAKAYITNEGDIETHQFIEKTENIITEAEFAIPAKSSAGNGKIEMRNGVMAYGLQASTYYYSGDSESSNAIFKGKFKANTQYYFDLFMDVDTMWYSGGSRYVPGGLVIRYTDGTSAEVTAQSTDGANGWKRVQYYSDPAKSIYGLGVYYYIGTKWYLRHDSGIYEVDKDNAQITSKYTAETTQVTETSFETNALIHSSGNVVGRETIEI